MKNIWSITLGVIFVTFGAWLIFNSSIRRDKEDIKEVTPLLDTLKKANEELVKENRDLLESVSRMNDTVQALTEKLDRYYIRYIDLKNKYDERVDHVGNLSLDSSILFCQENFPKKAVVEGDTVVLVTPKQVTVMNLIILERDALEEELQLLRETLLMRDSILTIEKRKNSELWEVIKNKDRQVENLNLIIDTRDKQFKSREKVLQKKNGETLY